MAQLGPLFYTHSTVTFPSGRLPTTARAAARRSDGALAVGLLLLCVIVVRTSGAAGQAPQIDTSRIGPAIGQRVPDFSGRDQFGREHTLASSLGAKGVMLVFFRSADW